MVEFDRDPEHATALSDRDEFRRAHRDPRGHLAHHGARDDRELYAPLVDPWRTCPHDWVHLEERSITMAWSGLALVDDEPWTRD